MIENFKRGHETNLPRTLSARNSFRMIRANLSLVEITKQPHNFTMTTKTMHVAVEPRLKRKAEKVLDALGLDVSSAVNVFLKKVVATHSIPFAIAKEPPLYRFTVPEEEEILAAAKDARDPGKVSGPFQCADELIRHLRKAKA